MLQERKENNIITDSNDTYFFEITTSILTKKQSTSIRLAQGIQKQLNLVTMMNIDESIMNTSNGSRYSKNKEMFLFKEKYQVKRKEIRLLCLVAALSLTWIKKTLVSETFHITWGSGKHKWSLPTDMIDFASR